MKEVDNVLRIFEETKRALDKGDYHKIKRFSNQTIHSAALSQDPDNVIVAVLVYTLSKIMEREHYREMEGWKTFYTSLRKNWDIAISALHSQEIEKWRVAVGKIRNSVNKIDSNLKRYIQDTFKKAGINKAFKIYEHGLSSEQTAKLLGVTLWDLAEYIGNSGVNEASINETLPVEERVKIAEEILG